MCISAAHESHYARFYQRNVILPVGLQQARQTQTLPAIATRSVE